MLVTIEVKAGRVRIFFEHEQDYADALAQARRDCPNVRIFETWFRLEATEFHAPIGFAFWADADELAKGM